MRQSLHAAGLQTIRVARGTMSANVAALFGQYDAIVFIDDGKGRDARDDRSPLYFSARLFLRDDPAVETLAQLLAESRAEDWHATEGNSLFGHPNESRLLDAIFACDSWLYTMYSTYGEYRREEVHDQFLAELDADPKLRTDWRLDQLQGIALLRFASFLRGRIAEQVALGTLKVGKVRAICDRLAFFKARGRDRDGLLQLPLPADQAVENVVTLDLFVVHDESATMVQPCRPFLGLVDAEVWSFQRVLNARFADLSSVADRLADWQRGARNSLFTPTEFKRVFGRDLSSLRPYVERLHAARRWLRLERRTDRSSLATRRAARTRSAAAALAKKAERRQRRRARWHNR